MATGVPSDAQVGLLDLIVVHVDDVQAAAAFYHDVLGATVQSISASRAQVRLANVDVAIEARGATEGGWQPAFRVADIAAFRAHLLAACVELAQECHDVPGGVGLDVRDPGGNALSVHQYGISAADLSR